MRTYVAVLLTSLSVLAGCAGHAPGERHYYITPAEMHDVYGAYPLSNGDVLKISREHRRYWAEMNRTGRFEIVPVDSIVFVEKGGSIRLTFEPLPFTTQVQVDGVADSVAQAPVWGLFGSAVQGSGIERKFSE
ncbi:MAG: hypothetical protein ACJ8LG_13270 [Massilia sp.]